ncbi:hypothetical protein [Microviridae sp.]|nr:hypothetical protein [Microviridae sp.]
MAFRKAQSSSASRKNFRNNAAPHSKNAIKGVSRGGIRL